MNRLDKFEEILKEYEGKQEPGLESTVHKELWQEALSGFDEKYQKQLKGMSIKTQKSVLKVYCLMQALSSKKPDAENILSIYRKNFQSSIMNKLDTAPYELREYCDDWQAKLRYEIKK